MILRPGLADGAHIGLYVCAAGVADINSDAGATREIGYPWCAAPAIRAAGGKERVEIIQATEAVVRGAA